MIIIGMLFGSFIGLIVYCIITDWLDNKSYEATQKSIAQIKSVDKIECDLKIKSLPSATLEEVLPVETVSLLKEDKETNSPTKDLIVLLKNKNALELKKKPIKINEGEPAPKLQLFIQEKDKEAYEKMHGVKLTVKPRSSKSTKARKVIKKKIKKTVDKKPKKK